MVRSAILALLFAAQAGVASDGDSYTIRFGEQLHIEDGLRLTGESDSASVSFFTESSSVPAAGSVLRLYVEHSPNLDGARSYLSVSLNYGVVRSLRLEGMTRLTEVLIPVPPSLFKAENRLEFQVQQRAAAGAPAAPLRTSISALSSIEIQTKPGPRELTLNSLPAPFVDPRSYRSQEFDVLMPEGISTASLQATVRVIANLCRRMAPESVRVRSVKSASDAVAPLLVVGTAEEHPILRNLDEANPKGLDREAGLIALISSYGKSAVPALIVTGPTPRGVLSAANTLCLPHPAWKGKTVRTGSLQETPLVPERRWPGYIPDGGRFTIAEIGGSNIRLDRSNGFKASLKLRAIPDFAFGAYTARAVLQLSVDPAFIDSGSHLEVSLNGKRQRRLSLKANAEGSQVTAEIQFPGSMLGAENNLSVAITPIEDRPVSAVLLASSRFQLQHDISVTLPDLGLLRHGLYPLSVRGDLSDAVLLMPRNITAAAYNMALAAAAEFGRMAPGPHVFPRVKRLADLSASEKSSSHFVYLRSASGDEPPASITATWPARTGRSAPGQMVQEIISPWNSKRVVLLLDASGHSSPQELVRSVFGKAGLDRLSGDLVHLDRGEFHAHNVSSKKVLGTTFYIRRLEAWLGEAWYRVPVVVGMLSLLLYLLSLTAIRYHRRQTHLSP